MKRAKQPRHAVTMALCRSRVKRAEMWLMNAINQHLGTRRYSSEYPDIYRHIGPFSKEVK